MEEQNSFDEFFRESLADYRETPPPAAWEMVAARLDEDDRRRRRGFFYWPWVALSLLLMVGGAWWLYGWINGRPGVIAQRGRGQQTHYAIPQNSGASFKESDETALQAPPDRQAESAAMAVPAESTAPSATPGGASVVRSTRADRQSAENTAATSAQRMPQHSTGGDTRSGDLPVTAGATGGASDRAVSRSAAQQSGTEPENEANRNRTAGVAASADAYVRGTRSKPGSGKSTESAGATASAIPAVRQQPLLPYLGTTGAALASAVPGPVSGPIPELAGSNEGRSPAPVLTGLAATMPGSRSAVSPTPHALGPLDAPSSQLPDIGQRPGAGTQPKGAVPAPLLQPSLSPEPAPALVVIEPVVLMVAIEPVMHLFAGAALPPVIGLYETGLLDPEHYYPPVEPVVPVAVLEEPAAAPAMLPPDSNQGPAKSAMSLSAFFGYERGVKTPPRNMFTVGLSLLWQLSEKFSIGMQPALVYGNLPRTDLTGDKAYQRSSTDVTRFTTREFSPSVLGQFDTVNNYVIREAFDSIIVRGTYLKGSLWQLELPLILQFNPFGPALRVYGGPSMYFGGSMKIQSDGPKQTYTIDRKDSIVQSIRMTEEQLKNYFGKSNLESYSNYDPNAQSFDKLDPVRFGYQFGIGFQKNRMSVDLSVRQQLSGYHQLSPELRQLYMNPVFRFGFGYLLIPQRIKQPKPITQ